MDLAPTRQAQRLEPALSLDELTERMRDAAALHHDHPGISLGNTVVEYDGTWRFNGKAGRLSRHALGQLCSRLSPPTGGSIPASYLARCPAPLAAENLNYWLNRPERANEPVLVRTKVRNGDPPTVRAVLSDRYAMVDHLPLLEALARHACHHELGVQSWALDDESLTLRLTFDRHHPASLADPLRVGVQISNSEVGLSQVTIMGLVTRLVCTNGLVIKIADLGGIQRRHVGRAGNDLLGPVLGAIPRVVEEAEEAAYRFICLREEPAPRPVEAFVKRTAEHVGLTEEHVPALTAVLEGESVYDVVNAFTRVAQRFPVVDRVRIETAMSQFLRDGRNWN